MRVKCVCQTALFGVRERDECEMCEGRVEGCERGQDVCEMCDLGEGHSERRSYRLLRHHHTCRAEQREERGERNEKGRRGKEITHAHTQERREFVCLTHVCVFVMLIYV